MTTSSQPLKLHSLMGNHAHAKALKSGAVSSPLFTFDFVDEKTPNRAFKRVVRDLEFDFCELAIVTYLQARAKGVPLVMLPATVVGRYQQPFIAYNPARGVLKPTELHGKRVGVRASSQTTVAWIRGILMHEYGVDLQRVQWISYEDAHVADCPDPAGFTRAPAGKELLQMLLDGEIDAGVVTEKDLDDPRLASLIPEPKSAIAAWQAKYGAVHINHMAVVKASLSAERPDVVRELHRLLKESKAAAGLPQPGTTDLLPYGVENNRRNLELLIQYSVEQGLIPAAVSVDSLFDATTAALL